jgi:hypothetical protein
MKSSINLLEQFDGLGYIEPSTDWNDRLLKRLESKKRRSGRSKANQMLLLTILVLLAVNLFTYTRSFWVDVREQKNNNYKKIASEFLITTNSSKY